MVGGPYTLPEASVLYALGRDGESTATALGRELSLDLGYLSRLLQGLKRRGLLRTRRAAHDARLRGHRPGDTGWVLERHAVNYHAEYGWGAPFEALVAGIIKEFLEKLDPQREACWIAERNGERVGSVFLSAGGWSSSASPSRARRATAGSCSGRTPTSMPRAPSIARPGSASSRAAKRTPASARAR